MRRGRRWRRWLRGRRSRLDLPQPPGELAAPVVPPLPGRYLGTTGPAGTDLADPVTARLTLSEDGLLIERTGQRPLWIATGAMTGAHTVRSPLDEIAVGDVLVVSWTLDGRACDTSLHGDDVLAHLAYVRAIDGLVHPAGTVS